MKFETWGFRSPFLKTIGSQHRNRTRIFLPLRSTTDGTCATLRRGRWQKAIALTADAPYSMVDGCRWMNFAASAAGCNVTPWWRLRLSSWLVVGKKWRGRFFLQPKFHGRFNDFAHIPWEDTPNPHKERNSFRSVCEGSGVSSRSMWVRS